MDKELIRMSAVHAGSTHRRVKLPYSPGLHEAPCAPAAVPAFGRLTCMLRMAWLRPGGRAGLAGQWRLPVYREVLAPTEACQAGGEQVLDPLEVLFIGGFGAHR